MTAGGPADGSLATKKCAHHAGREAVALCPECGRSFCRECVVEHEFRMICAGCLAAHREVAVAERRGSGGRRPIALPVWPVLQAVAGCLLLWYLALTLAQMLIRIPSRYHEGIAFERLIESTSP